jgi:deoxyribodipyrimidine photolyase-related protein
MRTLILILGDQLDRDSAAFDDFDPKRDRIWMAEVREESTHVWSHKVRTAMFLSAMRHFRADLKQRKWPVEYCELDAPENRGSLAAQLQASIEKLQPERLLLVLPGDYRVLKAIEGVAKDTNTPLEILDDTHFYSTPAGFAAHAKGRKQLRLEFFYRELRKQHTVLMTDGKPEGGDWNYDADNRGAFPKAGPGKLPAPRNFRPDALTKQVLKLVEREFASHPGDLSTFDWPVTPKDAEAALEDFITHRLPHFGDYQDAMWTSEPWLYHSRLSAAMNLKLLSPRTVVEAAVAAYEAGRAPLASVEGFVRQILGWREYVRGIYWHFMPKYVERNALGANVPLPDFYWTGETECNCLREALGQTLKYGYAHHIQRLMVTGLYSLLLGVDPRAVHEWYLAVYVDAVEWVELPNTLGMSQYADGGVMASKPYAATGKYIDRMSNYCRGCRFDPAAATGPKACPFTTLYWDFLQRHRKLLSANQRMSLQVKNLDRKSAEELAEIRALAARLRGIGDAPLS